MKNVTDFRTLFNDLPLSMLAEHPVDADDAPDAVIRKIQKDIRKRTTPRHRRLRWIVPVAAVLSSFVVMTAAAVTVFRFTPQYSYHQPPARVQYSNPYVEEYVNAVDTDIISEANGVRITLDRYSLDPLSRTLCLTLKAASLNGEPLNELTAERVSQIAWSSFGSVSLQYGSKVHPLKKQNPIAWQELGATADTFLVTKRTDSGENPCYATYQLRFTLDDSIDVSQNRNYTLTLTDLTDTICVSHDLSFMHESMQALCEPFSPAATEVFEEVYVHNRYESGEASCYYTLPDSGLHIPFSVRWCNAYVDNIGFYYDKNAAVKDYFYVSFANLPDNEGWPVLIDTTTGIRYRHNVDHSLRSEQTIQQAADGMNLTDGNRVTLCYEGVTPAMLPNLFMLQDGEYETVTRFEGQWEFPLTVAQDEMMTVFRYETDTVLQFDTYTFYATSVELTDRSVYINGHYTVDGTPTYDSLIGGIDLRMKDGTYYENPLYQCLASADFSNKQAGDSGTCRFGQELDRYIDASEVEAVFVFGREILLNTP